MPARKLSWLEDRNVGRLTCHRHIQGHETRLRLQTAAIPRKGFETGAGTAEDSLAKYFELAENAVLQPCAIER